MNYDLLIVGLGNALHGDDGFGPRIIAELQQKYRFPENVRLVDGGIMGITLLPLLEKAKAVIVVDTVVFHKEPGTLYKFSISDIEATGEVPLSLHEIGFIEAVQILREEGKVVAGTVIGVEPDRIIPWTTTFSPAVEEKVPQVMEMVLREIEELGGRFYA
jgi:hydrogenase maturation protease